MAQRELLKKFDSALGQLLPFLKKSRVRQLVESNAELISRTLRGAIPHDHAIVIYFDLSGGRDNAMVQMALCETNNGACKD